MMKAILTLLFSVITCCSFAQEHAVPKEKWSKDLYISDEFCAAKGLKPGKTNSSMRVWNSETTSGEKLTRVVDIRYYFASQQEAEKFLESNATKLSENGDPVKSTLRIPDAGNLRIYDEGAANRNMNLALSLESHSLIFLFVVSNYVCKVFVFSENELIIPDAAEYAAEAAKRLNKAIR